MKVALKKFILSPPESLYTNKRKVKETKMKTKKGEGKQKNELPIQIQEANRGCSTGHQRATVQEGSVPWRG